jgi:hypothetical protein
MLMRTMPNDRDLSRRGRVIAAAMRTRHLRFERLARIARVPRVRLARLMTGDDPHELELAKLAPILHVSISDLALP